MLAALKKIAKRTSTAHSVLHAYIQTHTNTADGRLSLFELSLTPVGSIDKASLTLPSTTLVVYNYIVQKIRDIFCEMSIDRDSMVYMAKLAEQAERFDEMVDHMKAVAKQTQELSVEERNLLSVAYKNVI